ncbi:MAG: hypothetical protein R3F20_05520 [Planctomycetota bacterium]
MSARRVEMHRLQEAVRLHRMGRSHHAIAKQLRMGRDTVRQYFDLLTASGLLEGPADELPEPVELRRVVEAGLGRVEPATKPRSSLDLYRDRIEALMKRGATRLDMFDSLVGRKGTQLFSNNTIRIPRLGGPSRQHDVTCRV